MRYVTESDIRVKCYDHSNLSRASVVQFRASRWVMSPNRTSVWKVITIRLCRELPLFNFERLDILCTRIGHPSEILSPFEFLESFRCSISSVSIYNVLESDIRVKTYDHSNLSRASVVQFRASRYIIFPNRTSVWKVITIRLCRELPLFNFERLDILCTRIGHPSENLWPFEFVESFRCSISSVKMSYVTESDIRVKSYNHSTLSRASVVQFWASRYIMYPNRTSEWNFMTIRISRELSLFNFERQGELCPRIGHPVKSYEHSNFESAFVVQFRASRYFMSSNQTSEWNVMTIQICRDLPLFNFERLDELCHRNGHPCEILWPFEFVESFRY